MKASTSWMESAGSDFRADTRFSSCAHLTNYTVQYGIWGEGPPLVLIPGMAGGYELFGPLATLLARDFTVISYQLRGEDNCFALRRPFGLTDLVDDLKELLDYLCLETPTIMGVSFGGIVGLEFAARYPHLLNRLIVQGAGARYEKGLIQQVAGTVLSRFPLPADNPFINQFFNLLFGGPQKANPLLQFVTRQIWQTDQSVMAHRLRLVESYSMDERLHKIRVPTLILSGDKDVLVSKRSLADLHAGIDDSILQTLPRAGHLASVTHPEAVAARVREFMACAES